MKDKGLGDTIERFTKATGIKALVDKIPGDCGCNKRKKKLNNLFSYPNRKKKINSKSYRLLKIEIKNANKNINKFYKDMLKNHESFSNKEEFEKTYQEFVHKAYEKARKMQNEIPPEIELYDGTVLSGEEEISEFLEKLADKVKINYEQT